MLYSSAVKGVIMLAVCATLFSAPPKGWYLAGSKPQNYVSGVDDLAVFNGRPSAYLKYTGSNAEGFGTLMQDFQADQYLGKRVRFSAEAKAQNVDDWAGLWMRVDKGAKAVAFDNMQNRSIKGTTDWRHYEIVLDVPKDATGIYFGILLSKTGTVWINGTNFEVVDNSVASTSAAPAAAAAPTNLGFDQ